MYLSRIILDIMYVQSNEAYVGKNTLYKQSCKTHIDVLCLIKHNRLLYMSLIILQKQSIHVND